MTSHVLLVQLFLAVFHVVWVVPDVEVFDPERESYQHILPSRMSSKNASEHTIYGIMFDAGSTGTRIHIYTFVQKAPGHPPELEGEVFESVKPGLSAYVDQPEQCAESVRGLLEIAKDAVPPSHWKSTPVVLMATAGLRLLPEKKAQALLAEVKEIFEDSPFLVTDNSVGIMNGTYEGILGWITVNFLTGQLYGERSQTFGTLDLGGASTQITFLPEFEETVEQAPQDFLTSFEMFDSTYSLYTHSYLGLGLKAARLATLGVSAEGGVIEQRLHSSCLPQGLEAEWVFAGVNYHYGGKPDEHCPVQSFQNIWTEQKKTMQEYQNTNVESMKRTDTVVFQSTDWEKVKGKELELKMGWDGMVCSERNDLFLQWCLKCADFKMTRQDPEEERWRFGEVKVEI